MNKLQRLIILALWCVTLFWMPLIAYSATYYVDTTCDDNNVASATVDGSGYDPATPACTGGSDSYFVTIADINTAAATLEPGDTISFRKGQTWVESLTIPESGTDGNEYTYTSHGTGALPIIKWDGDMTGWDTGGNWTEVVEDTTYFGNLTEADPTAASAAYILKNKNQVFTCPGTGSQTVVELSAWVKYLAGDGAGNIRLGLYDTSENLIAQGSAEVVVDSASAGWVGHNAANLTPAGGSQGDPVTITGGTNYRIAVTTDDNDTKLVQGTDTSGDYGYAYTDYTGGLPNPIAALTDTTLAFSMRAGVSGAATNQWTFTLASAPAGTRLWLDGVAYTPAASAATVDATDRWFWTGGTLTVYATENPATFYSSMDLTTSALNSYDGPLHISQDYINISDIEFIGGWCSIDVNGANHVDIDNVTFGSMAYNGADFRGTNTYVNLHDSNYDSDFTNTTYTTELGGDGVRFYTGSTTYSKIYNNTITDAFHSGINITGTVINTMTNNEIYNNEISCPNTNYGRGIELTGTTEDAVKDNLVYNNYMHDLKTTALAVNGNHNKYYYNIISGVDTNATSSTYSGGIYLSYNPSKAGSDELIYGNVIYDVSTHGIWFQAHASYPIANNIFKNNIIMNWDSDSIGSRYAITTNDGETEIGAVTFENNIFYKSGVTDVVRWKGTDMTVAEFEDSVAGVTASNNVNSDPLFHDPTNGKFYLKPGSPAINAGANLGASYDDALLYNSVWPDSIFTADQDFYGGAWEIGAYAWAVTTGTTGGSTTGSDFSKGLIAHWPLTTKAQDATYGAKDVTPYGNHGVVSEAVVGSLSTGFDGIDDKIESILTPDNIGTNDLSFSAWIKPASIAAESGAFVGIFSNEATSSLGFNFGISPTAAEGVRIRLTGTNYEGSGYSGDLTDGAYHHLVATLDRSGNALYYIDGVNYGSSDISAKVAVDLNSDPIMIGRRAYAVAGHFSGFISDPRIYNRLWSAAEAMTYYQQTRGKYE